MMLKLSWYSILVDTECKRDVGSKVRSKRIPKWGKQLHRSEFESDGETESMQIQVQSEWIRMWNQLEFVMIRECIRSEPERESDVKSKWTRKCHWSGTESDFGTNLEVASTCEFENEFESTIEVNSKVIENWIRK